MAQIEILENGAGYIIDYIWWDVWSQSCTISALVCVILFYNYFMNIMMTCWYIKITNPKEASKRINEDLEEISKWAKRWLVVFSAKKLKKWWLPIRTSSLITPHYSWTIKRVTTHKHLGLNMTSNLFWDFHIKSITTKATRCLGMLKPLKWKLSRQCLEMLYKS